MKTRLEKILRESLAFPESANIQQRGIADKIEDACNVIIKRHFDNVVDARSRRSIEDITIDETYVDHKTSDESLNFKMPNLISIDRLMTLKTPLVYNFVIYNSVEKKIIDIFALDVYELNWDYLKIQNLGAGQLQITNMNNFLKSPRYSGTREQWLATLKLRSIEFYDKLITKTANRRKKWEK